MAAHRRHAWPQRLVAECAERQGTMISHAQLLGLGVAPGSVASAIRLGRLYRVHRGVYSLVPPGARPRTAAEHAGLLACGPEAVLSHWSAAWLHGLSERRPRAVQLTVAGDRGRRRAGLEVHRSTALDRADRTRVGALWATSAPRTVIDLAPQLTDSALEPLIDRALRGVSASTFAATLRRLEGRAGSRRVRALLDPQRPSADAWSEAERRVRELLAAAGVPAPESNVPLGPHGWTPDLLWREQRVIVEYDSWQFHRGPASFHADRARHNELTALGYVVIHVTWRALRDRPEQVLVWIVTALARAGR